MAQRNPAVAPQLATFAVYLFTSRDTQHMADLPIIGSFPDEIWRYQLTLKELFIRIKLRLSRMLEPQPRSSEFESNSQLPEFSPELDAKIPSFTLYGCIEAGPDLNRNLSLMDPEMLVSTLRSRRFALVFHDADDVDRVFGAARRMPGSWEEWPEVKINRQPRLNLRQCLSYFVEPETLQEDNKWFCPQCREHVRAVKQMALWRVPHILVVGLKRFAWGTHGRKITHQVTFLFCCFPAKNCFFFFFFPIGGFPV
jgi:hypothetical protein